MGTERRLAAAWSWTRHRLKRSIFGVAFVALALLVGRAEAAPGEARPLEPEAGAGLPGGVVAAVAWTGVSGPPDLMAAVVETHETKTAQYGLVTYQSGDGGAPDLRQSFPLDPGFTPTGLMVLDVNDDAKPELIVLGHASTSEASSVAVFQYRPGAEQPGFLAAESAALDGSTNGAELKARLPLTQGLSPEQVGSISERAMVGRLHFSNEEQLRRLFDSRGAEVCEVKAPANQPKHQACRRVARSSAKGNALRDLRHALDGVLGLNAGQSFSCSASPPHCETQQVQGEIYSVDLVGSGPQRRLRRATHTDEEIGE